MVAIRHTPDGYPMAPSQDEWDALGPAERIAVVDALPGREDLIARLEGLLEDTSRRAEEESRRAEEESNRANVAEAELAKLREEIARLKK